MLSLTTYSQRVFETLNENWSFSRLVNGQEEKPTTVNIPHSWNTTDIMDDEPGYFRGTGVYRKTVPIPANNDGRRFYLHGEGANQVTELIINGKLAGKHIGGYGAFYIPVTSLVKPGSANQFEIRVDNSHNLDIPPLSADFTFFGGLYRDVNLLSVNDLHFSFQENYPGVLISTPNVSAKKATLLASAYLHNESDLNRATRVRVTIKDAKGKKVSTKTKDEFVNAGEIKKVSLPILSLSKPRLWSPENPYLYETFLEIIDPVTGTVLDTYSHKTGFRWFHFDAKKGFFLNGKSLKLVGTSRHQDYPGLGNALPDSIAVADIMLLKKMGGNFLRVAHYPQDPVILKTCDSLGILTSVEIPVVNEITESAAFRSNVLNMQREMIRQHYNHASVIIWCYMNEVLLRMPSFKGDKEMEKKYLQSVKSLAYSLDSLSRVDDASRYTMMAHHGNYNQYRNAGLVEIPQIVGWNLYSGWYGGRIQDFPSFLDSFQARHPEKILVVSEYGADADPRIRSLEPVRFDKSIEYAFSFHQFYWSVMRNRPFVAAAMIWNLSDFHSETRSETMPHINNKGLAEWNRQPKDLYYYYQAVLSETTYAKILHAEPRTAWFDAGFVASEKIRVATNQSELELFVNGQSVGWAKMKENLCEWNTELSDGWNHLQVLGLNKNFTGDTASVLYRKMGVAKELLEKGRKLNLLFGGNRTYTDKAGTAWLPARKYVKGSAGYNGGKAYKANGNDRLPYGSDKNIRNTDDDPIYQTQQIGIEKFTADLPTGDYEVMLCFAELEGEAAAPIPYNLSETKKVDTTSPRRVFHIVVNDELKYQDFDVSSEVGRAVAINKTFKKEIKEGEKLEIRFEPVVGEPILNAIEIRKIK